MFVIGLSGKAGAGKSTVSLMMKEQLESEGKTVLILPFASELKRIARDEFGWDGEKDDKGRRLLQVIGTECGRHYNSDIWINKFIQAAKRCGKDVVIADDMRFENEAAAIRDMGGVLGVVVGRSFDKPSLFRKLLRLVGLERIHASEQGLSAVVMDFVVGNTGTEEHLSKFISGVLDSLRDKGLGR